MTSDDRKGELFVVKNNPLFHQGRSGIVVRKLPLGTIAPDEEHVEVDWLNGNLDPDYENPVDVGSGHFRGIPYERKGKAVVKWINARSGNLEETLNEEDLPSGSKENNWSAKIGRHQQTSEPPTWNIKSFTNEGWALATDPWGDTDHWLPPRWKLLSGGREGQIIDQIYSFTRGNGIYRYEVAMQQTVDD